MANPSTAPRWRKSSHSSPTGSDCVELADLGDRVVGVRDSKNPTGPILRVTRDGLAGLLAAARRA